jgi:hypothetical protein
MERFSSGKDRGRAAARPQNAPRGRADSGNPHSGRRVGEQRGDLVDAIGFDVDHCRHGRGIDRLERLF